MAAFLIVACLLFAWSVTAERLARWSVTAPLAFALAGAFLNSGEAPWVQENLSQHGFQRGVEVVLALLLFLDACESTEYHRLKTTAGEWRLLGIALPLTIGTATLMGAALFPDTGWWLLLVTALVVMPIDLAPISTLLADERVPLRVRAALNVEGGLNDGLISPLFVFAVAHVTAAGNSGVGALVWRVVRESVTAVLVGALLGAGAAWLVRRALAAQWATPESLRLATLAVPFLVYTAAVLAHGNGFVAAFVSGVCYAPAARALGHANLSLVHHVGQVLAFAVWFVLGGLTIDQFADGIGLAELGYALLALTVVRFLPVMLSLTATVLTVPERAAVGWFGSRGVTSIVFATLAAGQLPPEEADFVVTLMCATVLLSVLLHGLSVRPIALAFARGAAGSRAVSRGTKGPSGA
ncbi:cation:proton antiporter [Streptomyces sp. NPDC098789]|uniref:cation:proton antiporter domain-containing protein n=1 Tax=Streptomyces sp. NPDC098789 TaxID=3366098 RepID=UPI00380444AD